MREEILTIGLFTLIAATAACTTSEPAPAQRATAAAINVWEPIDPGFNGCEGG